MPEALLQVEDLSYTYGDGTTALTGVSFSIAPGERVGLIGPNGSGKSTLLLCLAGLLFGRGRIRTEGAELTAASARRLRGRIGLVFQSPDDQLFMPTLEDDLAFGPINAGLPESQVRERVGRVAEAFGLSSMLQRAPHHLSLGQKRNAAIAAVLALEPSVLLMDEPSSNLDHRARRQLLHVLAELPAAMLIASHDLLLVQALCDRVILLDEGRIAAAGPCEPLLTDAALMASHGLEAVAAR